MTQKEVFVPTKLVQQNKTKQNNKTTKATDNHGKEVARTHKNWAQLSSKKQLVTGIVHVKVVCVFSWCSRCGCVTGTGCSMQITGHMYT